MQDALKVLVDPGEPEERRIEAARALARGQDRSVIDGMLLVAEAAAPPLARAIAEALRELGAHEAQLRRLGDGDAAVRADAARKLSRLQDQRTAEALVLASKDEETIVRRQAVRALSYLRGPKAYDALSTALRDGDPETRAYAAMGVGRSGDPRATRVLVAARELEEDLVVQDFIDAALKNVGEPAARAK
jgi:hypothetical protein